MRAHLKRLMAPTLYHVDAIFFYLGKISSVLDEKIYFFFIAA